MYDQTLRDAEVYQVYRLLVLTGYALVLIPCRVYMTRRQITASSGDIRVLLSPGFYSYSSTSPYSLPSFANLPLSLLPSLPSVNLYF